MLVDPTYFTADMVRALPDDGKRYELVWGELLVSPSPGQQHQRVAGRLFVRLTLYCERQAQLEAVISPSDVSWGDDTLVQPDVYVIPIEEAHHRTWTPSPSLQLVVEVLSPSTMRYDRFAKRRLYQERRVPLVWLVDIQRQWIEVWTPDAQEAVIVRDQVSWHPEGATSPLRIDLAELFRDIAI